MLISRIRRRISSGTVGRPPRRLDFQRQYNRNPARCQRTTVSGLTIEPIQANEYQSVDGAEGEFLWSRPPQNVYLLSQRQNFCLERYPRPKQIDNHPTKQPA